MALVRRSSSGTTSPIAGGRDRLPGMASHPTHPTVPTRSHQPGPATGNRQTRHRVLDGLGLLVLFLLPLAVGYFAYKLAGQYRSKAANSAATSADFANLQSLIQLTIAAVISVGGYGVLFYNTVRNLRHHVLDELKKATSSNDEALTGVASVISTQSDAVHSEIVLLQKQVDELDNTVTTHLRALADLHDMQVFFNKEEALLKARNLQVSAAENVEAMWTLVPYDDALKSYFAETLSTKRYTRRIVAARTVNRDDLLDHIDQSWEYLAGGSYVLHLVRECNYEALIVDHTVAGLFFYSSEGYGSCFMESSSTKFVQVVRGLYMGYLDDADGRVPIKVRDHKDIDRIAAWLDDFYKTLS